MARDNLQQHDHSGTGNGGGELNPEELNASISGGGAPQLTSNLDVQRISGNRVTVSANSFQSVYDGVGRDIIGGSVSGAAVTAIRYTFDDGLNTTYIYGDTGSDRFGAVDGAGNVFRSINIMSAENVRKVEFYNNASTSNDYGYGLLLKE